MKNNSFQYISLGILAGILICFSFWVSQFPTDDITVIEAETDIFSGSFEELEKHNKKEFPISYMEETRKNVCMKKSQEELLVVETTWEMPQIMDYQMISGAFLSPGKLGNYLVLNENAAYQLFGSTFIVGEFVEFDDENWKVLGVIQDLEKDSKAYIKGKNEFSTPTLLFSSNPENPVSQSHSKDSFQKLGFSQIKSNTFSIHSLGKWFGESSIISVLLILNLFFLQYMKTLYHMGKTHVSLWKIQEEKYSIGEWIKKERGWAKTGIGLVGKMLFLGTSCLIFARYIGKQAVKYWLILRKIDAFDFGKTALWMGKLQTAYGIQIKIVLLYIILWMVFFLKKHQNSHL